MTTISQETSGLNFDIHLIGEKKEKFIIFIHGFGVKYDSRGFFSELSEGLKEEYCCALFDLNEFLDGGSFAVPSYAQQADKVNQVIEFINNEYSPEEINLIAHSMGSIVSTFVELEVIKNLIMLAPTPSNPYARYKKSYFSLPGSELNPEGTSILTKKDGRKIYLSQEFIGEMAEVDPLTNILFASEKTNVTLIKAAQEEIVTETYEPLKDLSNIAFIELPGNHSFDGSRQEVVSTIRKILNES